MPGLFPVLPDLGLRQYLVKFPVEEIILGYLGGKILAPGNKSELDSLPDVLAERWQQRHDK